MTGRGGGFAPGWRGESRFRVDGVDGATRTGEAKGGAAACGLRIGKGRETPVMVRVGGLVQGCA